jgi:ribonuclease HII
MNSFDKNYLVNGIKLLAGVDEAGRGPLAGPVVAAAVIFESDTHIEGVADSKTLSENKREFLFEKIISECLSHSISIIDHEIIDEINILNASLLAMKKAVEKLDVKPDLVLVDGNKDFVCDIPILTIVKGDAKSFSIGAASILAKVTRDRLMKKYSLDYPNYLLGKNKGYPTLEHRLAVLKFGPSPIHRKTFLKKLYANSEQFELEKIK